MENNRNLNDEEFLKRVENAAKQGASKGTRRGEIISSLTFLFVILIAFAFVSNSFNNKVSAFFSKTKEMFSFDSKLDEHDIVLEDDWIFGHTAADFEEAILGDGEKLKKLEVYTIELSDASTITDTGFANIKLFSKSQVITFYGTAVYTVDLSKLNKSNIVFDGEENAIVLKIPHTKREDINIPLEKAKVSDTEKGWLAFGEIKLTVEESKSVENEVRNKMGKRLEEMNIAETADRFAKLAVWEIYQPIVTNLAPQRKLVIEFI